jgi:phosphoribosylformylglycinamidine synthase I
MKFGIIVFPGSNCDHDMEHVLGTVFGQETHLIWHKETNLNGFTTQDCIVLPGGFSYGDYLRSGAIASQSPIMKAVKEHAAQGGLVWGICNGFQILCESGLLPGALLHNQNRKFICKNLFIRAETTNSAITRQLNKGEVLSIPIAHAEGRFYADKATLDALEANDQVLFRYASATGEVNSSTNANGAERNIAGICNATRNVFGMMPHPERAAELALGNADGAKLFESLLQMTGVTI